MQDKSSWYVTGLALLGRSQPAVPGMAPLNGELKEDYWYEICRAGEWDAMLGTLTLTEDDLQQMAETYDPNWRQATVGIGHPGWFGAEEPRHGIISELLHAGGRLYAKVKNLSEELKEGVKAAKWNARSIEIQRCNNSEIGAAVLSNEHRPVMLTFDLKTDAFVSEVETTTTLSNKGVGNMDKEIQELTAESQKLAAEYGLLQAQLAKLKEQTEAASAEIVALKQQLAQMESLKASHDALASQLDAERRKAAEKEVAGLLHGVPKSLQSEDTTATLVHFALNDRKTFDAMAAPFKGIKAKFAYVGKELTGSDSSGGSEDEHDVSKKPGYVAGKSEIDNRISVRTEELLAAAKQSGKPLTYAAAAARAFTEIHNEQEVE